MADNYMTKDEWRAKEKRERTSINRSVAQNNAVLLASQGRIKLEDIPTEASNFFKWLEEENK